MSLAKAAALVRNQEFMDRLSVALVQQAIATVRLNDVQGKGAQRHRLAQAVLVAPPAHVGRFSWAVAADSRVINGGLDSPTFDATVATVIKEVWGDLAESQPTPPAF